VSVQFGRWNFDGAQVPREYVGKVSSMLAPYGPDSDESYSQDGTAILYRAFHTTKESRREKQPTISESGAVITWDGRLDNRDDLICELGGRATAYSTDAEIVAEAYERCGTNCFAKLVGDWALSIWDARQRSLILAKDPIGPHHLYYSCDDRQITWCTVLDPLVLLASKSFKLCEEYVAGWLSLYPATHLTPYMGISSVPPSCCVFLGPRKHIVAKYWDFDPSNRIRYRSDAEYEEHFRAVFAKAVQRRLRSDSPVLAELSGGKDSGSIVCMADDIIANGVGETPRLDTISYYDDFEPNWNERPYFTKVEEKRGRTGWHIDISLQDSENSFFETAQFRDHPLVPTPGRNGQVFRQVRMCLESQGNRVVLSGIGGDEVMGGAPIPTAELQDLLARGRFGLLAHQLKMWALQKRKPWFHLLLDVALGFSPFTLISVSNHMRPPRWLASSFVNRHWVALTGYRRRVNLFAPLPSFQDNRSTLNGLRRQLASKPLVFDCIYEKSYPYLDRSLLEFMYAIPREQSVRPTQRRSLMRRALAGIVPGEILNRQRKASVARAPLVNISNDWASLVEMTQHMISDALGIVDSESFIGALDRARRGEEFCWIPIMRTIHIEGWFRSLLRSGIVGFDIPQKSELKVQSSVEG